jgi:hypothetical protein
MLFHISPFTVNISIMLSKGFIHSYIKISLEKKQILSDHTTEIYADNVNLTVLEDVYSVHISHKSRQECTSSTLLHKHPFPRECCSQNGCRARVPVLTADHFSFLQEQNISDLEHL